MPSVCLGRNGSCPAIWIVSTLFAPQGVTRRHAPPPTSESRTRQMSTRRKEIARELLDALCAAPTAATGPGGRAPPTGARREDSSRRQRRRADNWSRRPAGGNGASVFQDIRARRARRCGPARGEGSPQRRAHRAPRAHRRRRRRPHRPSEGDGGMDPPSRDARRCRRPRGRAPGNGRPRLKKLRLAAVLAGLALLALVSWFFGIMMSVAQDLPALENRAIQARQELGRRRSQRRADRDADRQRAPHPGPVGGDLADRQAGGRRDRGRALLRAPWCRLPGHRARGRPGRVAAEHHPGGSTITQQFVKNALRAQDSRTVFQKLREAALAYHLERRWSKDKILTEYLNSIYFGEGAYGIESAAQTASAGTTPGGGEEEALRVRAPPRGGRAARRDDLFANRLLAARQPRRRHRAPQPRAAEDGRAGRDVAEQYEQSAAADIPKPAQIETPDEESLSPYFTSWLRQQVVDRYGAGVEAFGGGLEVQSTIDLEFQQQAEETAYSTLAGIEPTASIVVIDNKTGGVLAMVGGNDFEKEPFNLATNGRRQPGSAFKPYTLVTALQNGVSPDRVFASQPKTFRFKAPGATSRSCSRSRTTTTTTSGRRRWRLPPHTPTTPSTPSSGSRSGPTRSRRRPRRWASRRSCRPTLR